MNLMAWSRGMWQPFRQQPAWKITRHLCVMRFWMVYLIHFCGQHRWMGEKVVVCSKKKGSCRRRGWQVRDRPSRCQQRHPLHRDIVRVAICCLSLRDVRVQQSCSDGSQHRVLYEALGSGTASKIQHALPLKGVVQITSHLKHTSSPGHTLSFRILTYLPISHSNEKLLSKTAQEFTTPSFNACSQQHRHRDILWRDLFFFFLLFLCISASQRLLTNRIIKCEETLQV